MMQKENTYSSDEVLSQLLGREKGLVFLSAPSNGGKTRLLQSLKSCEPDVELLSGERFLEMIMGCIQTNREALAPLFRHKYIGIEDLDWYGGREHTNREFAITLQKLAQDATVIVTGIDLKKRMPTLFSQVRDYSYYEKPAPDQNWTVSHDTQEN